MKKRQLSKSIELRINKYNDIAISVNPRFFVTDEDKTEIVRGNKRKLYKQ